MLRAMSVVCRLRRSRMNLRKCFYTSSGLAVASRQAERRSLELCGTRGFVKRPLVVKGFPSWPAAESGGCTSTGTDENSIDCPSNGRRRRTEARLLATRPLTTHRSYFDYPEDRKPSLSFWTHGKSTLSSDGTKTETSQLTDCQCRRIDGRESRKRNRNSTEQGSLGGRLQTCDRRTHELELVDEVELFFRCPKLTASLTEVQRRRTSVRDAELISRLSGRAGSISHESS